MVSKAKQLEREEKQRQAELKAPDEFQKIAQTATPWLEKHGQTVFIAVGVVLVLGLIGGFISQSSKRSEEAAQQELSSALKVLARPVNATPPAAVEGQPAPETPFKNETEKDEALVKSLTDFRSKYAGKVAASSAALPLAQALLRLGKPQEVVTLTDEFLKATPPGDPLRAAAVEARGYAFEAANKFDEASAAFQDIAKETSGEFMKGMGQYHRARLLLAKGQTEEGAKAFAELQASMGETSAGRLAKERIALLTSQGVAVPVIAPPVAATDAGIK
jgi:hypothetical protein